MQTKTEEKINPAPTTGKMVPLPFLHDEELEEYKLHRRFDRMGRLVGDHAMKAIMKTHVMVIGLGGVGSYAAEMIVRSGVGKVTLVDFDEVCVTNANRQLHALQGNIGKQKSEVLAERFRLVNPKAEIVPIAKFYDKTTSEELLDLNPDWVIDAIDSVTSKCHLLNACRERGLKVVSSAGSGGKIDPTLIRISDLSETIIDPLAKQVRKILRQKYGWPREGTMNLPTVFSTENVTAPFELKYDNGKGFRCVCPQGQNEFFNCDSRSVILGTAGFVTAPFGMACSSVVIRDIVGRPAV